MKASKSMLRNDIRKSKTYLSIVSHYILNRNSFSLWIATEIDLPQTRKLHGYRQSNA